MCVCVCGCLCSRRGSGRQIESSLLERGTMRPQPLSYLLFWSFLFFFSLLCLFSLLLFSFPFKIDSQFFRHFLCIFFDFWVKNLLALPILSFQFYFLFHLSFILFHLFSLFYSHLSVFFFSSVCIFFDNVSPAETPSAFSLSIHLTLSLIISLHMHVQTVDAGTLCSRHADMQMPQASFIFPPTAFFLALELSDVVINLFIKHH